MLSEIFFFSSRRRHTRSKRDWSSDVCSSDLPACVSSCSQAIATEGKKLYTKRRREQWLKELTQAGRRYRAERMFEQLDALQRFRRQARRDLFVECRKHAATAVLTSISFMGSFCAALLIARVTTQFRFHG